MPDKNTLYEIVMRYSARCGLYNSPEAYPWQANAHYYWMVTGLYNTMRAQGLSEQELRLKCRSELQKIAARIQSGELIPPPRPQVEKLYVPTSTERAVAHIRHLKALLKANGTKRRSKLLV